MRAPHTPTVRLRRLLSQTLLGGAMLTVGLAVPQAAGARAAKFPAPVLKVEAKTCQIGPTVDQRTLTATASAILRGPAADRVALRFTIQQKLTAKTPWETLWAQSDRKDASDTGPWEIGSPGGAGLRFTKTFVNLAEGTRYRMLVDARGLDTDGAVVTRTSRRIVSCLQPLFSADVRLMSATPKLEADGVITLDAKLFNAGRLASAPSVVTVMDLVTRRVLGRVSVAALNGRKGVTVKVPLTGCSQRLFVVVEDEVGADGAPASAAQVQTPTCPAPQ